MTYNIHNSLIITPPQKWESIADAGRRAAAEALPNSFDYSLSLLPTAKIFCGFTQ